MSSQLVPRFEFGQFHKFLVSLGLVLCLVALAVPWFVLRESDALRVSSEELEGLTAIGRATIERKQEGLHALVVIWPYVSTGLLVFGSAFVALGLTRWRTRQAVLDRMEDLSRAKLEDEVRQLTPAEVDRKIERESAEASREEASASEQRERAPQPSIGVSSASSEFRARVFEVEALVASKLRAALSDWYELRPNLAVRSSRGTADIDVVAEAKWAGGADLVVEVRVVRRWGPTVFVGDWLLRAARNRQLYSEATGRKASAVLWMVADGTDAAAPIGLSKRMGQYMELIRPPVYVLTHTRDELERLTNEELRAEIDLALVFPEQ